MARPPKAAFGIEIDFERGTESPSRVFKSMSQLIETFEEIDRNLVQSIDAKIEPIAIIEDIEVGSLRAWLGYALRAVDDDALKSMDWKKAVGKYLVKAKYLLLNFADQTTEITDKKQIEALEQRLLSAAQETDVTHFPSYVPANRQTLLDGLNRINQSLSHLGEKDRAIYRSTEDEVTINASFKIVPEKIEELLTHETIRSGSEMILKVKKPDYLGESQWEFRHGTKPMIAKITDAAWLKNFHDRQYDIRPGDSLRCTIYTTVNYGYDNEVVATHYEITEVREIIRFNPPTQIPLLPG